jgi:4'-phosphopantetheinyl transferase
MRMSPEALALEAGDVHWWGASLDLAPHVIASLQSTLNDEERDRADRFAFPHLRRRYVVARGLLRQWLAGYLERDPADVRFAYEAHGKPVLDAGTAADLRFNVSHTGDLAVFAATKGHSIGVDVEALRPMPDALALADRFFSPSERQALHAVAAADRDVAFFSCWTRKEAYVKATGEGLTCDLESFDVSVAPGVPARLLRLFGSPAAAARWTVEALDVPTGFIGAVAVAASEIRVRNVGRTGAASAATPGSSIRTACRELA